MKTLINRKGRVTQLSFDKNEKNQALAVINFQGGYAKFKWSEIDLPDGLMLGDECEVSINFKESD